MATDSKNNAVRTLDLSSTKAINRPDFQRDEYKDGIAMRTLTRALAAGTKGVRAMGEDALPRWPGEQPAHYKIRASMTQVARYYAKTVQAVVGMILATPPKLAETVSETIKADCENIDGKGTHIDVFARNICTDMVHGGFVGILVDAPPIPDGIKLTLQDQQKLGLRPYCVPVQAEQIISWIVDAADWDALLRRWQAGELDADQVKQLAGQMVVHQVVIKSVVQQVDGEFGVKNVDTYRVIALDEFGVRFTVWEHRKGEGAKGEYFIITQTGVMESVNGKPLPSIPLPIGYSQKPTAPFVCEPAYAALAELNLDHYQISADRRYLMKLCHAPTLFLAGFEDIADDGSGTETEIKVGPNSVLRSRDPKANAAYVSADPRALDSSKEERLDLVSTMASLGMSFLGKDRRSSTETATGRELDEAAENSSHAVVGRALQDLLEEALRYMALYRGLDEEPEITINTTYADASVDPQIAALLWQAVVADRMPMETWIAFIRTGQLPDDFDAAEYAAIAAANADADMQNEDDDNAAKTGKASSDAAPKKATPSPTDSEDDNT